MFLQNAAGAFLGSLPLMCLIGWSAFPQGQRLARIEQQLDKLGDDLKSVGVRVAGHDTKIGVIEAKLDGPRLVQSPR